MNGWVFKSRAVSDWSYVFYSTEGTEAEARQKFNSSEAHAKAHGGAGSLEYNGVKVDQFSHWCSND